MDKTTRILVVDDDPLALQFATMSLVREGYKVLDASTGKECLQVAHVHHPDIIVLDVMLPDMTGLEVCRQIKTDKNLQDSLIILISGAMISPEEQADGLNIGADGYLVKPYSKKEFLARVRSLERIKQAEEALRASETRYKRLFESSRDGILILEAETGRIDDVNPYLTEITEYDRSELVGKKLWEANLFEDAEKCKTVFEKFQRLGCMSHEDLRFQTKNFRKIDMECVSSVYDIDDRKAILCNFRDITARKEAENEALLTIMRHKALLELYQMGNASQEEIAAFAVETCARIVDSEICCIGFAEKGETILDDCLWCSRTMGQSAQEGKPERFIMGNIELWFETIKLQKPLIVNDLQGLNIFGKALPDGCASIVRFMGIPIVDKGRVVAVAGVANKPQPYNESDSFHVTMLLNGLLSFIRQRDAEKILRESEKKYRVLLDNASDAILIADLEGKLIEVNKQAEDLLGYSKEELRGMNVKQIYPENELYGITNAFNRLSEGRLDSVTNANIMRKDGKLIPVDISGNLIKYGEKTVAQGIFRDTTERRQIEKERRKSHDELERKVEERTAQLSQSNKLLGQQILERDMITRKLEQSWAHSKSLYERLKIAREEERTFLSRELHDGLGQILTVIGIDLFWLSTNMPEKNKPVQDRVASLLKAIDDAILSVQELSAALRHSSGNSFSVTDSIKAQLEEFERRTGILCEFISEPDNIKLGGTISTDIFRIFQEALTNIIRHSGAKKTTVFVQKKRGQFVMEIRDDGKGITRKQAESHEAIGLRGMRERASLMGGNLTIAGISQKGTTVILSIPLQINRQENHKKETISTKKIVRR